MAHPLAETDTHVGLNCLITFHAAATYGHTLIFYQIVIFHQMIALQKL